MNCVNYTISIIIRYFVDYAEITNLPYDRERRIAVEHVSQVARDYIGYWLTWGTSLTCGHTLEDVRHQMSRCLLTWNSATQCYWNSNAIACCQLLKAFNVDIDESTIIFLLPTSWSCWCDWCQAMKLVTGIKLMPLCIEVIVVVFFVVDTVKCLGIETFRRMMIQDYRRGDFDNDVDDDDDAGDEYVRWCWSFKMTDMLPLMLVLCVCGQNG